MDMSTAGSNNNNNDNVTLSSDDTLETTSATVGTEENIGGTQAGATTTTALGLNHRRTNFISRHRAVLERIATDSTKSRRYNVPDRSDIHLNRPSKCTKITASCRSALESKTASDWAETFLPCLRWLKSYPWKSSVVTDMIAGMTVGVMVIPQSMSYAKLAGLPVEYGLYSALVPVYAYALFGSSRQLAVGPVALISLLLASGLDHVCRRDRFDTDEEYMAAYTRAAVQCSMLVGATYIAMGLLRMGFVTIFLSHAVVSGFTAGAAVIIGMSQLKYIFGYDVEGSKRLHEQLYHLFANIDQFNWKTFLMGMGSILLLVGMKNAGKQYPKLKWVRAIGPLSVTAITIVLVVALNLDQRGIPIVSYIPEGLPAVTVDFWSPIENFGQLYVVVISIVIVGFMESIAIAKQLASKHKYEIDSSLELIGLGMANFFGGMFQSYPVTGSFSRSAVNNESGAQSGISAVVTATMVGFTLLLLTGVFEKMPLCVLSAIVISGVLGLLDYDEAIYLWKVHKFDFMVWMVACLGTMFLGVEIGLAIAVGVSLLIVIYESAYPHTSVLGRLPGTSVYRNVKQYPEAERYDQIVMVRIDASLYFANAQNIRDKLRKYRLAAESELAARRDDVGVRYLILEMGPVSHLDTSALHILDDMNVNFKQRGQQLCFSSPNLVVMDRLVSSGLADKIGRQHIFTSLHDAVTWCLSEMDNEAVSIHETRNGAGSSGSLSGSDEQEASTIAAQDFDAEDAAAAAVDEENPTSPAASTISEGTEDRQ